MLAGAFGPQGRQEEHQRAPAHPGAGAQGGRESVDPVRRREKTPQYRDGHGHRQVLVFAAVIVVLTVGVACCCSRCCCRCRCCYRCFFSAASPMRYIAPRRAAGFFFSCPGWYYTAHGGGQTSWSIGGDAVLRLSSWTPHFDCRCSRYHAHPVSSTQDRSAEWRFSSRWGGGWGVGGGFSDPFLRHTPTGEVIVSAAMASETCPRLSFSLWYRFKALSR